MRKKRNAALLYFLFISVCLLVSYILKETISNINVIIIIRDFFLLSIIVAPTWLGSIFLLPYLNNKKIGTTTFLLRVSRNVVLALCISVITTIILYFIRIVIYNAQETNDVLNKFIINFIVNISFIQFIEYYTYYIKAKNETIKVVREKNKILKLQHKVLKEQINPHFLFNSLNVLSSLIYDDQDKANQYTKELSKLYRYILSTNQEDLVSLAREIQFIKSYFYILQLRFVDAIILNIDNNNEAKITSEFNIVPLTLQLLIENAIKHNAFSKDNPLIVSIKINDSSIIVSNNKNKKNSSELSTGKGLEYIKTLYQKFGKVIEINDTEEDYIVKVPLL